MQNNLLGDKPEVTQSASTLANPPVPQEYSATVSSGSFLISLIALLTSGLSLRQSRKLERGARFESAYGAPLRDELRSFQKYVMKIKAFAFPSGKAVGPLKAELEILRVELEEASNQVGVLLRELDMAATVTGTDWEKTFASLTRQAEETMQAVAHPSVSTELAFRAKAEDAQGLYQRSIDDVRTMLDAIRAKV